MDGRNHGVSPIGKAYRYDYDAVEPLTDVKVHTNVGREDGEEDIPDWFFGEGTVFLPGEMAPRLRIEDRDLGRAFLAARGEVLTVAYWGEMQRAPRRAGPMVHAYPVSARLRRPDKS